MPVARALVRRGREAVRRADQRGHADRPGRRPWELYRVADDPAENHNLAGQHRDKLIELIAMWYAEAGKYNVFPIDASAAERLMTERPQVAEPRDQLHLPAAYPDAAVLGRPAGTQPAAQHHRRRGDPRQRSRGRADLPGQQRRRLDVLRQRRPTALSPQLRRPRDLPGISGRPAPGRAPSAPLRVRAHRQTRLHEGKGTPGLAQLYVDGQLIANTEFPLTTPIAFNPGGLTCRANPGSAIVPDYQALAPFPFTGTLHTVTVDLSGDLITDTDSEIRMAMARQ